MTSSKEPMKYEGTKQVKGLPMTRGEYNKYRCWDTPDNEDPNESGYLVEYLDGGTPNHPGHTGYISWSPADVFERAYKPLKSPVETHPTNPDLVAINNVHLFAQLIGNWHSRHLKRAEHILSMPAGAQIQLDDEAPLVLEGDVHKAFLIGVNLVLSEFGVLPFMAETEDTPVSEDTISVPIEPGQ